MKKVLVLILVMCIPFIFGNERCQTTGSNYYYDANGTYIEITNPPEQCVLYRVLGDTTYYKSGLFVANYAAIKAKLYSPEDAHKALDQIEAEVLRQSATVGSVINTLFIVAAQAAKVGAPEIVLVTKGLSSYKGDMTPLDDCTRYKLVAYIGEQRALVQAFGA